MESSLYKNLFKKEHEVWQIATAEATDERYRNNPLLVPYRTLSEGYYKLLRLTQKIFCISDNQGLVLQQSQNEIRNLLDNIQQGILTFGPDFMVNQQYSAECGRIFNGKIAGKSIIDCLAADDPHLKATLTEQLQNIFPGRDNAEPAAEAYFPRIFHIGSREVRVECKLVSRPDDVKTPNLMMILTDLTEKLNTEKQIYYLSYHDKLTSLYNRAYVEYIFPAIGQPVNLPFSVIMLDLNGLKLANDGFGHLQGDALLVALSNALRQACRATDIIARWGGDEFLILLPRTSQLACQKICRRIGDACHKSNAGPLPLSAAIGSATQNENRINLSELFRLAERRMYKDKQLNDREVRQKMIRSMEKMLYERGLEDRGYHRRIMEMAGKFISAAGLHFDKLDSKMLIQLAGLHDVGKIAIAPEIINKRTPLTVEEWEIIKNHSEIGCRIVQSVGEPGLADQVLALHERWDGQGYPYGLRGEQIPVLARLFSLVDAYDAMTHDRPYRAALNREQALAEIKAGGGRQFDPELTQQFLSYMKSMGGAHC